MKNNHELILETNTLPQFYEARNNEIDSEAERLQSVASKLANPVSIAALSPFLKEGSRVLDIGAGADHELGNELRNTYGCQYVAVDPNDTFITMLQQAGIEARQGDVVDLPIESNSIDVVHMRFLFGWLNAEQRKAALSNAVRVLKPGEKTSITVIDYDWLRTDGPEEYMEAVALACDILKSFGFDYEYGNKLSSEIKTLVDESVAEDYIDFELEPQQVIEVKMSMLSGGKAFLDENANSLVEGLHQLGDRDRADAIGAALRRLDEIDEDSEIVLPGIVVQTLSVLKYENSPELPTKPGDSFHDVKDAESFVRDLVPTSIPEVLTARQGSPVDTYIRRVQAAEYLKAGLLTSETMIDGRGMLCEQSYPKKYLDRSTLFVSLPEGSTLPTAAVRLIETEDSESQDAVLRSLPTAENLGLFIGDRDIFPEHADASGVIEISAFIRNSEANGTLLDMAKVIIGAAAEAKTRGHHTGLMTTQEKAFNLIKRLFGEQNFTTIKGPHKSNIPGASDTVDYVCLSVDVRSFLDGVREHCREGARETGILKDISSILETYYDTRS